MSSTRDDTAQRLSRRRLLLRAATLPAAVSGLLAACIQSDDAEEPAPIATPQPATSTEPARRAATPTSTAPAPTATPFPAPSATSVPASKVFRIVSPIFAGNLNPHVGFGVHGYMAARLVLEPLFDLDAAFQPVLALAAEWPTFDNGLLDPDGRWVIWRLRNDVKWHDGERFDAEDVAFTWEFITNPPHDSMTQEQYQAIEQIDILDDYTVRLRFREPNPNWIDLFRDTAGVILPEHIFRDYLDNPPHNPSGAAENRKIVGTGPWRVAEVDWNNGDLRFERFEHYWDAGKPYFDVVEYLPGSDSTSLAWRVLVTGAADWAAWLESVEASTLEDMASGSELGQVVQIPTTGVETLYLNFADPNTEVDGARAEPGTQHPLLSDRRVREALAHAIDREAIAAAWGLDAEPCRHLLAGPAAFQGSEFPSYDLERARALLGDAGVTGGDLLYQTSVNSDRQPVQEVVASGLEALGFSVEQKTIDAEIFFSSKNEPPETYGHFYADMQIYTPAAGLSPYPLEWAERFRSNRIAAAANGWSEPNISRYANPEFDRLHDQAKIEMHPERQAELWRGMMNILTDDVVIIPLLRRNSLAAISNRVEPAGFNPWAVAPSWNLQHWTLKE